MRKYIKCSKCGKVITIEKSHRCKDCQKIYDKERRASLEIKDKNNKYSVQYKLDNNASIKKKDAEYYSLNKEKKQSYRKSYDKKEEVILKRRERDNNRYKGSNYLRIYKSISANINKSLKGNKAGRKWETLVNYSLDELKSHLGNLFETEMNWNNYGKGDGKWNIDHKIPLKYIENGKYYWDQEELVNTNSLTFKRAWSLVNLQPKWSCDNISKKNYYKE